ncbi:MAG: fibronectin type III domain-containing protein, partial [Brevinema sp.]
MSNNQFSVVTSEAENNGVALIWIDMPLYSFYRVFRSENLFGEYTPISQYIKKNSFQDLNVVFGKKYYYKVQGYNEQKYPLYLTKETIGYAGKENYFSAPKNLKASLGQYQTKIKLTWETSPEAKKYEILRSEDGEFFESIATVYFNEYEDQDLPLGSVYYYQINSINKDGVLSSNSSKKAKGITFGGAANLFSKSGEYRDKIILSWDYIPFVDSYLLFRSESSTTIGVQIASLNDNVLSYEDRDIESSKIYYYTLIYQNSSAIGRTEPIKSYLKSENSPAKVENITASQGDFDDKIILSWKSLGENISYQICRFNPKTSTWKEIAISIQNTYTDSNFDHKSYEYEYRITAMNPSLGEVSNPVKGWLL